MRRQRPFPCKYCGQLLLKQQTRCAHCGRLTEQGQQFYLSIGIRILIVAAGFIFVFVQLPKIIATLS